MLILLEHVNLKIPWASGPAVVRSFFENALGCPECPAGRLHVAVPGGELPVGTQKQMHVNMGLSQIHFEWCTGSGRPYSAAQRFPGVISIEVDSLAGLQSRLSARAHSFDESLDGESVRFTCPFGSTWVATQASPASLDRIRRASPVRQGGVGHVVALKALKFFVQPGLAKEIAAFYENNLGAWVSSKMGNSAMVHTLAHQSIEFAESPDAPPANAYEVMADTYGIHICIYVSDFKQMCERNLEWFWINPDYRGPPLNDRVADVSGALERGQFRLKRVGPRFVLEHEVRGATHPLAPTLAFL